MDNALLDGNLAPLNDDELLTTPEIAPRYIQKNNGVVLYQKGVKLGHLGVIFFFVLTKSKPSSRLESR
jgi:hypothetical protein